MNKKTKIGIVIGAIVAFGVGVLAYQMKEGDQVVAMVNNDPVYESDVAKKFKELSEATNGFSNSSFQSLDLEMKKNIVKSIVITDIIAKKADEAKVENSSEFKKLMAAQEFQIKQRVYLEEVSSKEITEAKMKQKYEEFAKIEGNKEEIRATQILFQDEKTAKEASSKIVSVEQFDEIINKNNQDKKGNTGDMGYFTKDQMPPSFSEVVFASEPGKIVGPVKTDFGWHIVKIVDKRKVKVPSFEEMKGKIKSEMFMAFINEYVAKLEEENKIQILIK